METEARICYYRYILLVYILFVIRFCLCWLVICSSHDTNIRHETNKITHSYDGRKASVCYFGTYTVSKLLNLLYLRAHFLNTQVLLDLWHIWQILVVINLPSCSTALRMNVVVQCMQPRGCTGMCTELSPLQSNPKWIVCIEINSHMDFVHWQNPVWIMSRLCAKYVVDLWCELSNQCRIYVFACSLTVS